MNNRIKQYRYKLLHSIIATNENLFTWKLSNSPCCNFCNEMETVDHFLIESKCLDTFWTRISNVFKSCGVSKQIRRLQYLVIGYKSELLEYNWTNVLFSYIVFFCCERRKKQFNILNILIEELKVLETYCHTKNFKCNMMTIFMNKLCR